MHETDEGIGSLGPEILPWLLLRTLWIVWNGLAWHGIVGIRRVNAMIHHSFGK